MSTFTSNFAPQIEAMLDWRTSLGHPLRDMRNAMAGFDRFCASQHPGETVLTRELATAWCKDTATGTWGAYRTRAIREFGKYLQLTGADAFIVPSAWIRTYGWTGSASSSLVRRGLSGSGGATSRPGSMPAASVPAAS